jgi:hypothetical protein
MRILSQRCRTLTYRVTTASPCAIPLDDTVRGVTHLFTDCLLLHAGVEQGDRSRIGDAAKSVRRILTKTGADAIVINGFSHLGDPARRSDVPTAMEVLTALSERLAARGVTVHLMPFGWNKRWSADVLDGEWEQRVVHLPSGPSAVIGGGSCAGPGIRTPAVPTRGAG